MTAAARRCFSVLPVVILSSAISSTTLSARTTGTDSPPRAQPSDAAAKVKINLDEAVQVKLPQTRQYLAPVTFPIVRNPPAGDGG